MVPFPVSAFSCRIKLHDEAGRRLDLNAVVQDHKGAGVRISISAPYWIINKTSLPLVFKQEGTSNETAGQFSEHEVARVVSPLLFSLSDPEASPTIQARVGTGCHPDKTPQVGASFNIQVTLFLQGATFLSDGPFCFGFQWCQHFHLQNGAQFTQLRVSQRDHGPDIVYAIGINIRPGKGRYRHTNIVTMSPRFQLHNKSSYQLQFAQKCFATTLVSNSHIKKCIGELRVILFVLKVKSTFRTILEHLLPMQLL